MRTARSYRYLCSWSLAAVALLGSQSALAQTATNKATEGFVLLTYEVSNLVLNIQDHAYSDSLKLANKPRVSVGGGGGGFGGGGGGMGGGGNVAVGGGGGGAFFKQPANHDPHRITMDDLINVIVATAAPTTWNENGTGNGEIQPLGTALVVWQSPEVHKQIQKLLDQLLQGSGQRRTVMIDARWLLLNSNELDQLLLDEQNGAPQVDREMLKQLTRRPTSLRGISNCFSGQLVYLISGTRKNLVSSYIPVVGGSGVGYQPWIETPNFGALLEIRPTLMRDGNAAIVDLKTTLTVPNEQPNQSKGNPDSSPELDQIAIETQELATTLRIPLRQPTLVGGLTYVPSPRQFTAASGRAGATPQAASVAENPQLYLLLELR